MNTSILSRIDEARNMARSYELSVQPGLFGDVAVVRHWGRIGTNGQTKEVWFSSLDEARASAGSVLRQKVSRGYVLLSPADPKTEH